jgi:hypothetical protein
LTTWTSASETGAAGKHHRVQVVRKKKYRVSPEKWDSFFKWVAKNNRFDLLQKRISDDAVKATVEESRKKIPGVEPFDYVTVSLDEGGVRAWIVVSEPSRARKWLHPSS